MIHFATRIGYCTYTESPEYFARTIRNDIEKWGKLARDIRFNPQ